MSAAFPTRPGERGEPASAPGAASAAGCRGETAEPRAAWRNLCFGRWLETADTYASDGELAASRRATAGGSRPPAPTRWPRTRAWEAEAIVRELAAAAPGWAARPSGERAERIEGLVRGLAGDGAPLATLARRLELAPEAFAARHGFGREDLEGGLRWRATPGGAGARRPAPGDAGAVGGAGAAGGGGVTLLRPHWSELLRGAVRRLAAELARGAAVLWVVDPRLPEVGALVAEAALALAPDLPCAVVHDDGQTALRAVLASGAVGRFAGSGPGAELASLEEIAEGELGRLTEPGVGAVPRSRAAFGAGVAGALAPELALARLGRRTHVVRRADDPRTAAALVLREGLAPAETLGGQLPGSVGRVACHERVFSRFTAELLLALEAAEPGRYGACGAAAELDPGLWGLRGLAERLQRAREEGLGEGACLIHEGPSRPPGVAGTAGGAEGAAGGSRSTPAAATLGPLIFTNVEESMRLARLDRQAPLLALLRGGDDAAALSTAARLDRPVLVEGASGLA